MSRDTQTRRLTQVPPRIPVSTDTAPVPIVSLLAHTARLIDLLPLLHQFAIEATGGSCALLFEYNPRDAVLQATSGFGLDSLRTDPWMPGRDESMLVTNAFVRNTPTLVADAEADAPDLASRLGRRTALLRPLARETERVGLLAVGFDEPPPALEMEQGAQIADTVLTALELCRLRQNEELQRDIRELLDKFTERLSTSLNLAA